MSVSQMTPDNRVLDLSGSLGMVWGGRKMSAMGAGVGVGAAVVVDRVAGSGASGWQTLAKGVNALCLQGFVAGGEDLLNIGRQVGGWIKGLALGRRSGGEGVAVRSGPDHHDTFRSRENFRIEP